METHPVLVLVVFDYLTFRSFLSNLCCIILNQPLVHHLIISSIQLKGVQAREVRGGSVHYVTTKLDGNEYSSLFPHNLCAPSSSQLHPPPQSTLRAQVSTILAQIRQSTIMNKVQATSRYVCRLRMSTLFPIACGYLLQDQFHLTLSSILGISPAECMVQEFLNCFLMIPQPTRQGTRSQVSKSVKSGNAL